LTSLFVLLLCNQYHSSWLISLQTKDIDLIEAVDGSKTVIELLQRKGDEEIEWDQLFDRAAELAAGVDISTSTLNT
jgi:hypothetical protein